MTIHSTYHILSQNPPSGMKLAMKTFKLFLLVFCLGKCYNSTPKCRVGTCYEKPYLIPIGWLWIVGIHCYGLGLRLAVNEWNYLDIWMSLSGHTPFFQSYTKSHSFQHYLEQIWKWFGSSKCVIIWTFDRFTIMAVTHWVPAMTCFSAQMPKYPVPNIWFSIDLVQA